MIGSDQIAMLGANTAEERILGKPETTAACAQQLQDCSAREVLFVTAVAVLRHCDGALYQFVDTTRVRFRALDAASVERYVSSESPLDCAGGFKSEGLGIVLCESIESTDPTGLVGLPLIRLSSILRGVGFQLP